MRQFWIRKTSIFMIVFGGLCCLALTFLSSEIMAKTKQLLASLPTLRINSPFAAPIWRLDVDAEEKYVVSSSAYKALTLWPLHDLSAKKIIRFPIKKQQRKRAHGVAISPDSKLIAYSVPPQISETGLVQIGTAQIYLNRRTTGETIKILKGIPTRPQGLYFSPDGLYLAAVLSDGCGVMLWSVKDGALVASDHKGYEGIGNVNGHCDGKGSSVNYDQLPDTTGLKFTDHTDKNKAWFVTSGDTGVRSYQKTDKGFKLLSYAMPGQVGLERPAGIELSPDGKSLLVGDKRLKREDKPVLLRVAMINIETLKPIRRPFQITESLLVHPAYLDLKQNKDANQTNLDQVAWVKTEDEEWIYAGGVFWCAFVRQDLLLSPPDSLLDVCIARWSAQEPEAEPVFIPVGIDRVMNMKGLPKTGGLLYATQKRIAAIDFEGQPLELKNGNFLLYRNDAADFRGGKIDFDISKDGKSVLFRDYRNRYATKYFIKFDLEKLTVQRLDKKDETLIVPDHDKNLISQWYNSKKTPLVLEEPIPLKDTEFNTEFYRSSALVTGKKLVLFGSSDTLRLVSYEGGSPKILCSRQIDQEAFRLNLTPDGKRAIVGHSDGTIRWYGINRDKNNCQMNLLLSVYLSTDQYGEWVWTAWLPSGKFSSDPRAKKRIGWQIEDAKGKISFMPYRNFLSLYDREAIQESLDITDKFPRSNLLIRILKKGSPETGKTNSNHTLTVRAPKLHAEQNNKQVPFLLEINATQDNPQSINIKMGTGVGVKKMYDGKLYNVDEPIRLNKTEKIVLDVILPQSARLKNRALHVCFEINNARNFCHPLIWAGKLTPPKKRKLWAVLVGVAKHQHKSLNLKYTQNDVLDLANLFIKDHQKRTNNTNSSVAPDFEKIHINLLVTPDSASTQSQLKKLSRLPYVTQNWATLENIKRALEKIVAMDKQEELSNDLFLFYFAGHGFVHPFNLEKGRTALATFKTDPHLLKDNLEQTALTSDYILKILKEISAEKVVIFDACRTPSDKSNAIPFDPGLINKEFEEQVMSAHFMFSGLAGQYSLDQHQYAIDNTRPSEEKGNGLFSYAFISSLLSKESDLPGRKDGLGKIEMIEVKRFLDIQFDRKSSNSLATEFQNLYNMKDIQQPVYIPARTIGNSGKSKDTTVIRSLDDTSKLPKITSRIIRFLSFWN